MARICRACGLPLDEEHHDRERVGKRRVWGCRVRLVAESPTSGKNFVPQRPQRLAALNTRYVRKELLND